MKKTHRINLKANVSQKMQLKTGEHIKHDSEWVKRFFSEKIEKLNYDLIEA